MFKSLFHSNKPLPCSPNPYDSKCVCQICNCGHHHCPLHTRYTKSEFVTTFQHDYQPWKSKREKPYNFDRQPQQHSFDPNDLRSQYQLTYVQHPQQPKEERLCPPIDNTGPFYANSDYRVNFKKHPVPAKIRKNPPTAFFSQRITNWDSTYDNDFKHHPTTGTEQFRPQVLDGPEIRPDFASTTYKNSFQPRSMAKPQKCIDPPQHNLFGDPGQMGNSTYQIDYQAIQLPPEPCPVGRLPKRPQFLPNGKSHLIYRAQSNKWV